MSQFISSLEVALQIRPTIRPTLAKELLRLLREIEMTKTEISLRRNSILLFMAPLGMTAVKGRLFMGGDERKGLSWAGSETFLFSASLPPPAQSLRPARCKSLLIFDPLCWDCGKL